MIACVFCGCQVRACIVPAGETGWYCDDWRKLAHDLEQRRSRLAS